MCLITQVEGDSGHVNMQSVVFAGMSRVEQGLLMSQFIPPQLLYCSRYMS